MDHFAGLDVSVKETSICIVDDAGKIVREAAGLAQHLATCNARPQSATSLGSTCGRGLLARRRCGVLSLVWLRVARCMRRRASRLVSRSWPSASRQDLCGGMPKPAMAFL